jgi:protein-S-isoprenylcysteine O-methyltransferase Ste14
MDDRPNARRVVSLVALVFIALLLVLAFSGEFGRWAERLAYLLATIGFWVAVWQWIRWFATRRGVSGNQEVP